MKKLIVFIIAIVTIIASAGCINYGARAGEGFYVVVGILSVAAAIFSAVWVVKQITAEETRKDIEEYNKKYRRSGNAK